MSETRRDTLRVLGAAGALSALPLRGQQHEHEAAKPQAAPMQYTPLVLSAAEMALVSRVVDLIIPATDTPGALQAGVPAFIDLTLSKTPPSQAQFREGLAQLGKGFLEASEADQIALLTQWSDAVDRKYLSGAGARFFRTIKGLTIDGYYGSYQGLVQELGYKGNTALATFPGCTHGD